jgi:hypothetical protein
MPESRSQIPLSQGSRCQKKLSQDANQGVTSSKERNANDQQKEGICCCRSCQGEFWMLQLGSFLVNSRNDFIRKTMLHSTDGQANLDFVSVPNKLIPAKHVTNSVSLAAPSRRSIDTVASCQTSFFHKVWIFFFFSLNFGTIDIRLARTALRDHSKRPQLTYGYACRN